MSEYSSSSAEFSFPSSAGRLFLRFKDDGVYVVLDGFDCKVSYSDWEFITRVTKSRIAGKR